MRYDRDRRAGHCPGLGSFLLVSIAVALSAGCAPKLIDGQAFITANGRTTQLASLRIAFVPIDRVERYKEARAEGIRNLQDGAAGLAHANDQEIAHENHRLDQLHDLKAKKAARMAALAQKTADDRHKIQALKSEIAQLDAKRKAWNEKVARLNEGVAELRVPASVQAKRNEERRQIQIEVEKGDKDLVDVHVLEDNIAANDYVLKTLHAESADVVKAEQKVQAIIDQYAAATASAQAKVQAYIADSFADFIPEAVVAESDAEGRFTFAPPADHWVLFATMTLPAATRPVRYVWLLNADQLRAPLRLTNENLYHPADLLTLPANHPPKQS